MKAVVQAFWLSTTAFGNLIVTIVAEARLFENQAYEFFFFAFSMAIITLIFGVISFYYKYANYDDSDNERHELLESNNED